MSGGRAAEGAGCVTWWGLSPARDLLATGERHEQLTGGRGHSDGIIL